MAKATWDGWETKVVCEICKQWIGRLPNTIGNSLKSQDIARDAGWLNIYCISRNRKRGRQLWYCPGCAKKTTVQGMVDIPYDIAIFRGKIVMEVSNELQHLAFQQIKISYSRRQG